MGQLDTAACFGVLRSGGKVHGAWNGRFLPQQQGGISFFFSSARTLEIIYNRCFTFLNVVLICLVCLAQIIKQSWGCLSAPALLGDLASHLWKQLNTCSIPKKGSQGFY